MTGCCENMTYEDYEIPDTIRWTAAMLLARLSASATVDDVVNTDFIGFPDRMQVPAASQPAVRRTSP